MPQHSEQFVVVMPPQQAMAVCQQAVRELSTSSGWHIKEQSAGRLVCAESLGSLLSSTWPVTVEILVSVHPQGSLIVLNGSNFGMGPIQSRAVRSRVQNIQQAILEQGSDPVQVEPPIAAPPKSSGESFLDRVAKQVQSYQQKQEMPQDDFLDLQGAAASPGKNRIFISYRRDDSADVTGRIYDRLIGHYGTGAIFKDVDSIPYGVDFREHLNNVVGECAVVLAIIGDQWLDVCDESGCRRLDDPADWVRIEIESALKREIPVIPLLVRGASMPQEVELPDTLQSLAFRNGTTIRRDPDFHTDMDRLLKSLDDHLAGVG